MPNALVVDDNREMAKSLKKILEMLGIDVRVEYGARTAMQAIQMMVPDVIFLDVNMPGVDGFEVMAYFRRLPGLQSVPVIVVTSDDQPETLQKAKDTGVFALLLKPASIDGIETALKTAGVLS